MMWSEWDDSELGKRLRSKLPYLFAGHYIYTTNYCKIVKCAPQSFDAAFLEFWVDYIFH